MESVQNQGEREGGNFQNKKCKCHLKLTRLVKNGICDIYVDSNPAYTYIATLTYTYIANPAEGERNPAEGERNPQKLRIAQKKINGHKNLSQNIVHLLICPNFFYLLGQLKTLENCEQNH